MHEMAVAQGIIELCTEYASGCRVKSLEVEIGELSTVVPEAIEFCFEACSRGTLLEGSQLNIHRIPGRGECRDCCMETPLTELFGACQSCGSCRVVIISGEEMRVREIEVED